MDRLVQLLTGHERAVFTNGRFGFDVHLHPALLVLAALVVAAAIAYAGAFVAAALVRPHEQPKTPEVPVPEVA